jgi:hypothetical protein
MNGELAQVESGNLVNKFELKKSNLIGQLSNGQQQSS